MSFEVGEPGLAGLANAPRAAERASPKDVKVKAFMTTACTFGYLGSRTGVWKRDLLFSSNLQHVGFVAILYRLDFDPWWGLSDRTTVGGLRVVGGWVPGQTRNNSKVHGNIYAVSTCQASIQRRNMLHRPIVRGYIVSLLLVYGHGPTPQLTSRWLLSPNRTTEKGTNTENA